MGKWITCKKCGHEYYNSLSRCPECSSRSPIKLRNIVYLTGAAVVCTVAAVGIVLGIKDRPEPEAASSGAKVIGFESFVSGSESAFADASSNNEPQVPSEAESLRERNASSKTQAPASEKSITESKTGSASFYSSASENVMSSSGTGKNDAETVGEKVYVTIEKEIADFLRSTADDEEEALFEITEEDRAYGITDVKENADGSVTVAFEKSGYEKFTSELKNTVSESFSQLADPELTFLKKTECSEDLTSARITVDENDIMYADEIIELYAYMSGGILLYYQSLLSDRDNQCRVEIISANSGTVLATYNYPQDFPQ